MQPGPCFIASRSKGKTLILSIKQRTLLSGLLHRDLRKCSVTALTACQRAGWVGSAGAGYQLTIEGRRVAELSENAPSDQTIELDLS